MESLFRQKGLFMSRSVRKNSAQKSEHEYVQKETVNDNPMTLKVAKINTEYIVKSVEAQNSEIRDFLFTLGCYEGETVTLISVLAGQYIIVVKDARYSIDQDLAECIIIFI